MSVDITIQETVNVTRTTGGGGGVQSVTGTTVDNTDLLNPVINVPTMAQVLTIEDKVFDGIAVDRTWIIADRLKYWQVSNGIQTLDDSADIFPNYSLIEGCVQNDDINTTVTFEFVDTNCFYLNENVTSVTLNVGDFFHIKKAGAGAWILNVWNKGSGAGIESVTGTTDEITVSNPTTTPVVGISSTYTSARDAYADAKVEDNLTASTTVAPSKTAVNTALGLKQDKGNYRKLVAVDAGNTTHTGTLTETIVSSILIPANSLDALCDLFFSYDYGKNNPNATMIKVYLNTSNTLTGATLFASFNAGSSRNGGFFRKMILRGTSLDTQYTTASAINNYPGDLLFTATNVITLNPAVTNYMLVTITLTNSSDIITSKRTALEKLNLVP